MANNNSNEETNVITLEFEDGEEMECIIIGVFDYNGKEYIALDPDDGTPARTTFLFVEISA